MVYDGKMNVNVGCLDFEDWKHNIGSIFGILFNV